jgi:hypothetical protein
MERGIGGEEDIGVAACGLSARLILKPVKFRVSPTQSTADRHAV